MKNLFLIAVAMLVSCFATAQSTDSGSGKESSGGSVAFSDINAQYNSQGVRINWTSINLTKGGFFEIERASDGAHFRSLGSMPGNSAGNYSYLDNNPVNGIDYYRVSYTDLQGRRAYSRTVNVPVMSRDALKAYYNGSQLKVSLDLNTRGNYKIALINASGQVMLIKTVSYDGSVNSFDLSPDSRLNYGIYSLIVKGEGASFSTQILVN